MSFSDADLARLKERFAEHSAHCQDCSCTFGNAELPALLARMEAAETLNDQYRDLIDCIQKGLTNGKGFKEHWDAERTWRKACGK